jgi:hypothetical protein
MVIAANCEMKNLGEYFQVWQADGGEKAGYADIFLLKTVDVTSRSVATA